MPKLTVELPDRLAQELRLLVEAGWFSDESELARHAILDLVARCRMLGSGSPGHPARRDERPAASLEGKSLRAATGKVRAAGELAPRPTREPSVPPIEELFRRLLRADATGAGWLAPLLRLSTRQHDYAEQMAAQPGELLPGILHPRPRGPRTLELCFERSVPPSEAFLRWLIEHPEEISWPDEEAVWQRFKPDVRRWRRQLHDVADPAAQAEAHKAALAELSRVGVDGSRQAWWAFEGFSVVDVWLETEQLLLFLQDERNPGGINRWAPNRHPLLRILETAGEMAGGKQFAVLLLAGSGRDPITQPIVEQSLSHLSPDRREALMGHYLGAVPWPAVVELAEHADPGAVGAEAPPAAEPVEDDLAGG